MSATAPQRYLCIHGHFYQPPRENPWLEVIETQDSAAPYHDWNERITAECYAVNGAARILNDAGKIVRIGNNYGRISFNFGPTLLSWIEANAPRTYRMVLAADRGSQRRFGGHGSAIAQVYNHVILPLASRRDKITQIEWGIADFEHRFGRKPEGMWLAETAVDNETLDLMAERGIRFTLLAPHQCAGVRPLGADQPMLWQPTLNATVDTRRPYRVRTGEDRSIAVFFYDGPSSRAIAFEGLLNNGEGFARRLTAGFRNLDGPQLMHVATDGESYGHHHRHGEMALAYALKFVEDERLATLTNYGEFLERFPPEYEAEIVEDTSWSCAHGIERWRSDCGCNGGRAGWNQRWRMPLRKALDELRDGLLPLSASLGATLLRDVDVARNRYISVMLDRSAAESFFNTQATRPLTAVERTTVLKLMEMERHAQLMYTSCAWFFDDISGIETVQILAYACRVLQLARELFGAPAERLEAQFLARMEEAKSNDPAAESGAALYRSTAKAAQVDLEQVAAHYAISSVFTAYPEETPLFCYQVRRESRDTVTSGRARLVNGRARICSSITEACETVAFAVIHFGDQNITAAVRRYDTAEQAAQEAFVAAARAAAIRADFPEVVRLFDRSFAGPKYSIQSLFRDEQRRILGLILEGTIREMEFGLMSIYEDHAALLHFLSATGAPKPSSLELAANFAINAGLRRALEAEPVDAIGVRNWLALARADQVPLDRHALGYLADQKMKRAAMAVQERPGEPAALDNALLVIRTLRELPFDLNLWQAQNIWHATLVELREHVEPAPAAWMNQFLELGDLLGLAVNELVVEV